jgi:hypothetical protein
VALGKANLMADQNVDTGSLAAKADELRGSSATALFVAVGGKPGGIIAIADPIKAMTMMRNIRQNLVFAFAYNAIGIPVAAGVLYPTFGILLSPVITALAMLLSSMPDRRIDALENGIGSLNLGEDRILTVVARFDTSTVHGAGVASPRLSKSSFFSRYSARLISPRA